MSTHLPKLSEALRELAPDGIQLPSRSLAGGWSDEVEADGKCHYFTMMRQHQSDASLVEVVSLCGRFQGDGRPDELADVDPLAPENCKDCRRMLLQAKGLI